MNGTSEKENYKESYDDGGDSQYWGAVNDRESIALCMVLDFRLLDIPPVLFISNNISCSLLYLCHPTLKYILIEED